MSERKKSPAKAPSKTNVTKRPKPTREESTWGAFLIELTGFFETFEAHIGESGFPPELKQALLSTPESPLARFSRAGTVASEGLIRFVDEIESENEWHRFDADRKSILRDVGALKTQLEYRNRFIDNFSRGWQAGQDEQSSLARGLIELGNRIGRLHERILIRFAEWLARIGHERQASIAAMNQAKRQNRTENEREGLKLTDDEIVAEVKKLLDQNPEPKVERAVALAAKSLSETLARRIAEYDERQLKNGLPVSKGIKASISKASVYRVMKRAKEKKG